MNDTTASKPMWTRCNGCKDRVFNDQLDIGIHRQHCPADLQRAIQELKRRFDEVVQHVKALDEDLAIEPAVDLDAVAPWPGDDDESPLDEDDFDPEDDDLEDPTAGLPVVTPIPTIGGIA